MMTDVGGTPMVTTSGSDGMGGGWMAILLIALLFGGKGFGFGGGGAAEAVNIDSRFNELEGRLNNSEMVQQQFGIQKDILAQTNEINSRIERQTFETVRANDCSTRDIVNAIHEEGRLTRTEICRIEMDNLRAELAKERQLASEDRITKTIINNVQPPRAIPSYPVPSPYATYPALPFGAFGALGTV